MKDSSSKQIFCLIILLSITPFILFLGKNFLQTEFFTYEYFWAAFIYCLFFTLIATLIIYTNKKLLTVALFFAYFGFLQFYFSNMQNFLSTYIDSSSGYYILFFLLIVCLIAAKISNSLIFRKFIFILLFLNITISMLNLIPILGKSTYMYFKTTKNNGTSFSSSKNTELIKNPNIFYIVPDGLASPKILKEYTNISFENPINKLKKKGFSIPEHNYSSYNRTHLAFAALFKMAYPVTDVSPKFKDRKDFYPSIREKNPKLLKYLKDNNYKFLIVPSRWGGCPESREYRCIRPERNHKFNLFFENYALTVFFQNSLIKKISNVFNLFPHDDMDDSIKTTLNKMRINSDIWSEGGVFTFIHTMIPHKPYRNDDCSLTDKYKKVYSIEGYTTSVNCVFSRIQEITDHIINNYPNAAIIIQSDHGIHYKDPVKYPNKFDEISNLIIDYRLGNFTAVRSCKSDQAAKLNQVNIIKFIVECINDVAFTTQLENKSYFAAYENMHDYGKVFRVHKN